MCCDCQVVCIRYFFVKFLIFCFCGFSDGKVIFEFECGLSDEIDGVVDFLVVYVGCFDFGDFDVVEQLFGDDVEWQCLCCVVGVVDFDVVQCVVVEV